MKKSIFIIIINLITITYIYSYVYSQDIPLPGDGSVQTAKDKKIINLSGYIENTFNIEYFKKTEKEALLNNTRARINISGNPDKNIDFAIGIVGTRYTGNTLFDTTLYLPDKTELNQGTSDLYAYEYENDIFLQEAFATLYLHRFWIRAGRQKYYTGTGYAYNPSDLFNTKNPLDPTYEIDGIDAILATFELPFNTTVQGLMRVSDNFKKSDYLARIKTQIGGLDIGFQYTHIIKKRIDYQALNETGMAAIMNGTFDIDDYTREFYWDFIGGEFSGELAGIKLYGEGGYILVKSKGESEYLSDADRNHARFLLGFDYTFDNELYIMTEYLRLGQGRSSKDDITLNDRMAYISGEILSVNRDSLFNGISYPVTDITDLSLYIISGINDHSIIINPWIAYGIFPGASINLSIYMPTGSENSQTARSGPSGFIRIKVNF